MKSFLNFISEEKESDYLYHATYGVHKDNISKHGLKANSDHKNWEDSKKGRVYLAKDPHIAHSYAETSEKAPEHHLSHIVVYKVHKKHLDPKKLHKDTNVRNDEDSGTHEYHGDIPAKRLKIHSEHKD